MSSGKQFKNRLSLWIFLILLIPGSVVAQTPHTLTGDIRIHKAFHSRVLNNDRDIVVYLPPGYKKEKQKHYPVLYLNDGQNLFDGATAFVPGQEWHADETAESLITTAKLDPLIIVGIDNVGNERVNEYTPVADEKYKGGGADLYGRMLVEELKPFIDSTYRTRKDASHTGIGGSSLGALVSLYLSLKYPDVFRKVAVLSPSVWFANHQIVHYVESFQQRPPLRIWLDVGTKEGRDATEANRTVADAELLRDALKKKGWREGTDLKYFEDLGAEHNERAWAARFGALLQFLFPR